MKNILLSFLLISSHAFSQEQTISPANETDFAGTWRVVLIPNQFQKGQFKNEEMGYSDPCQFFINGHDKSWQNVSVHNGAGAEESKKQCPTTKAELTQNLITPDKSQFKWKALPNGVGYFYISENKSSKGVIWKADKVLTDMQTSTSIGVDLKGGDMLMQVIKPTSASGGEAVWSMVLRPLN